MGFIDKVKEGKIADGYALLKSKSNVKDYANEYNNKRDLRDSQVGKREDKITSKGTTKVSRIPIPFQRKIVKSASSFLLGSPVDLVFSETNDSADFIRKSWKKLRMDSLILNFCKTVKSETEATIIFFIKKQEGREPELKTRLISSKNGKVFPEFDAFGDLISFSWEYTENVGDKEVKNLYSWDSERNYIFKDTGEGFKLIEGGETENLFSKIPVVYMSQENPEWWEVQDLIDRFENSFSKFADTNDYFASPMYKAKGSIGTFPRKDETGKILQLDVIETNKGNIIEADLDVISWDRAPEALKLEFETAKSLINELSSTIDFDKLISSSLGQLSGTAIKLMFFSQILKAKWDEGDYQIVISRIINIIKSFYLITNSSSSEMEELEVDINFTSVLPENIKEMIEVLTEATGGKAVMSQKTAIAHNPLVSNDEEEMESIKEEVSAAKIKDLGESVI